MTRARYQSLIDAWRIATASVLLALLDELRVGVCDALDVEEE